MGNGWACIARFGGIGDNLIASSVFKQLKVKYGHLEVMTSPPYSCVFENNPYVDKISNKEKEDLPDDGAVNWQNYFVKRAREYDFFANLSHSCETLMALVISQTPFYWPAEFRRKLCGHSYLAAVHDICGLAHEFEPRFFPTDEERERALETKQVITKGFGGRCIGWVLSGTRIDKSHPHSPMIVGRLLRETGLPVVMFGAPGKEFDMAKRIQEDVAVMNGSDHGLHLALSPDPEQPSWPIRRLLTQAQHCDLLIGPDTGPMWAVASEPMPKVLMVSHASDTNITHGWRNTVTLHADPSRVPCWPCHRLHETFETCTPNKTKTGAACMSDISVEDVVASVVKLTKELDANDCCIRVRRKGDAGLDSRWCGSDPPGDVGRWPVDGSADERVGV